MSDAFDLVGSPMRGGTLIVADHAGRGVPKGIDLGIGRQLFDDHIAHDIGTRAVGAKLARKDGMFAILANYSRLVVDLNRAADDPAAVPVQSDGIEVPGNRIDANAARARIAAYHAPYHDAVARAVSEYAPSLILSLHSFTPRLRSAPDLKRPWEVGVLYNQSAVASQHAIAFLSAEGLHVGDQKPYSGRELNATMDRHAEATGTPYIGIEMRQDLVADHRGQDRFARLLRDMLRHCLAKLEQRGL